MDDQQLLRYARHILLDDVGIDGQQRLLDADALVIGAGGLGCAATPYLAAAGVGTLTLVDDDVVELSNLQRQILHRDATIGQPKVASAATALAAINPEIRIRQVAQRADAALLDALVPTASIVLDCSDNFATRHLINAACVRHRVPLVSGAAVQFGGQLIVVDPRANDAPCYNCLFPRQHGAADAACATLGVFAPLVGIIGTLQANEALRILAEVGPCANGKLLCVDAKTMAVQTLAFARSADCTVCAG